MLETSAEQTGDRNRLETGEDRQEVDEGRFKGVEDE